MKKQNIIIFSIFIILVLGIFIFYPYKTNNKCLNSVKVKLVTSIKAGDTINLGKEVNCFEWDSIIFITRDFEPDVIEKHTGICINGYKLMGFKFPFRSDFYTYIALLHKKQVVGVIETSGGIMIDDFITELGNNDIAVIAKKDATFITYLTNNKYLNGNKIYSITFSDSKLIYKYKNK